MNNETAMLAYAVRELATFAGYLAHVVGSGADTPMSERDGKFLTDHFERYQRAMEQVIPTIKDEEEDA